MPLLRPPPRGSLLLIGLAAILATPLLIRGLPAGHDLACHELWSGAVADGWRAGEPWPIWVDEAAWGAGNPGLLFYPPLTPLLAGALRVLGWSGPRALAIVSLAALCLSAWAAARLNSRGACESAALALLAPMAAYTIIIRAAVPELLGLAAWMLLLLAIREAARGGRSLPFALATAGLLLTHPLTAALTAPFNLGWGLAQLRRRALLPCAAAVAAGMLCAAPYLVPLARERPRVHYERLWEGGEALRAQQYVRWPEEDAPALARRRRRVALTLLLLCGLAAGLAHSLRGRERRAVAALSLAGAGFVALSLPIAEPLYRALPWLRAAQYPWRHLGPAGLLAALALGRACALSPRRRCAQAALALALLASGGLSLSLFAKGHWDEVSLTAEAARHPRHAPEYEVRGPAPEESEDAAPAWSLAPPGPRVSSWERRPGLRRLVLSGPGRRWRGRVTLGTRSEAGWRRVGEIEREAIPARSRWLGAEVELAAGEVRSLEWRYEAPESRGWGLGLGLLGLLGLLALAARDQSVKS